VCFIEYKVAQENEVSQRVNFANADILLGNFPASGAWLNLGLDYESLSQSFIRNWEFNVAFKGLP